MRNYYFKEGNPNKIKANSRSKGSVLLILHKDEDRQKTGTCFYPNRDHHFKFTITFTLWSEKHQRYIN